MASRRLIQAWLALAAAFAAALALGAANASALITDESFEGSLGSFNETHSGAGTPWAASVSDHHDGARAAFTDDPNAVSDKSLVSDGMFTVAADALSPRLSFFHRIRSEADTTANSTTAYDGGVLELAVDGGAFAAVPEAVFLQGGPNKTISSSFGNALGGRRAWGGTLPFEKTVVDLGSFKGHKVAFRFRFATDGSVASTGWWVDDVQLSGLARDGSITEDAALDSADRTESIRTSRNGVPTTCAGNKPFPGTTGTGPFMFAGLAFGNRNAEPACVTIRLANQPDTCALDFVSAYDGPFDASSLPLGYIGDAAESGGVREFSVSRPGTSSGTVHVEATAATTCSSYTLKISAPPPETTIPNVAVSASSATAAFASSAANSTFECALDDGAFAACGSSKDFADLAVGTHKVKARATDPNGAVDPTPASQSFTVEAPPEPPAQPSTPSSPPAPQKPVVQALSIAPGKFRAAARGATIARAPVGGRVSYTLSRAALATIGVQQVTVGRSVGGRCVKATSRNRRSRKCTRIVSLRGSVTRQSAAGASSFTFTGRWNGRKLAVGKYNLVLSAAADGLASDPRLAPFKIVAR